jgi:heme A synthase
MILVALVVYLSIVSRVASATDPLDHNEKIFKQASIAAAATLLLLLVGSYLSGVAEAKQAGSVVPDWPLMNGKLIPDLGVQIYALHFLHRVLAVVVAVVVVLLAVRLIRLKDQLPVQAKLAHAAVGLFALQILIGALNIWTHLNPLVVTAHLLTGALIWSSLVSIAVVSHPALESALTRERRSSRSALAEAAS